MTPGCGLKLDLHGSLWDTAGCEQPLSLRLTRGAPLGTRRRPKLSGILLLGLDHERVVLIGTLELRDQRVAVVRFEGVDAGGRSVDLLLESQRLASLRSLPALTTLTGTLTRTGEAPLAVRLRHDTRRALALGAILRRSLGD